MEFKITHTPMHSPELGVPEPKEITFSLGQIDQMYEGRGNCCRCGCGGNYYNLERNSRKIINALQKMESGRYDVESIDDYIFEITIDEYYDKWGQLSRTKVQTIYLNK
jgi:hypothetical protein